ncbi:methyl-accepting chemotaxis protein [Thermovenabulum gondwanense]|uniref:HAMP domain-containing protein n=1 Tax=Thermovenabulum gondwanense TaxID=520767 RepID=A0A161QBI2_9FIRM|nr:methyl-accepting chemotaxis protein [Thermovenabulum gondwanense]KYO66478.1 hypothetical protein ATZ99_11060 [Thermovenabulum gondwanense]
MWKNILFYMFVNIINIIIFGAYLLYGAFFLKLSIIYLVYYGAALFLIIIAFDLFLYYIYIKRTIIAPLNKVLETANELSGGDLSKRFTKILPGSFSHIFYPLDNFMDYLERFLKYMEHTGNEIEYLSKGLLSRLNIIENTENEGKRAEAMKEVISNAKKINRMSLQVKSLVHQFRAKEKKEAGG